ncbi:MAG: CPBP family intramembrane metalloprotease [Microbacterium sp.]|nr:CPBP family intramembrane metalloprotease [Microbacterium sp.]
MTETTTSGWTTFWNRGTWWKAVIAVVAYLVLFQLASLLIGVLFGSQLTDGGLFGSVTNVFILLTATLLVGAVLLIAFTASVGWFRALFGPQPIRGSWWMWIAVVIIAAPIVLRLIGVDYGSYDPGVVVVMLLTGLLIGFTEEVITRGIAVKILRDSGMRELGVAVVSSALFALMHSTNIFTMPPFTVAVTLVYTFAFGLLMYLTMRVTGSIVWPIILHGLTDPLLFLATGGIDQAATGTQNVFLALAGPSNIVVIAFGVVALFLIRGRVAAAGPGAPAAPAVGDLPR